MNIMKSFQQFVTEKLYKNHLNLKFWSKDLEFDNQIRIKILDICRDFTDNLEITNYVQDIILTGSIANYNYTKYSDLDVHIVIDFKDIDDNVELVESDLNSKRFIWNLRHNIMIRGHEVELYFQNADQTGEEPLVAAGIFSLKDNKWLKKPSYNPPSVDESYVKSKSAKIKADIDMLIKKINTADDKKDLEELYNKAKKYREKINKMRKDSLQDKGEFGIGNLVFKSLRNLGYIEKVINIGTIAYDKMFSE